MKILVVEDQTMFLEYIVSILRKREDVKEIITATNGKDAFSLLHENKVTLIITDLNLPKMNGLMFIEQTRKYYPKVKILVLTQYQNKGLLRKMTKLDVDGFLTKNSNQENLNTLLDSIFSGKPFLAENLSSSKDYSVFNDKEQLFQDPFDKLSQLSKRETEIMKILLENKSNQEIADQLFIGVETVITHRKNIYRKLGVNNILDLYKLTSGLK